jgi:hypothetical protein
VGSGLSAKAGMEQPIYYWFPNQRIRDVRQGPDGAIYVLTGDGALLRIVPDPRIARDRPAGAGSQHVSHLPVMTDRSTASAIAR